MPLLVHSSSLRSFTPGTKTPQEERAGRKEGQEHSLACSPSRAKDWSALAGMALARAAGTSQLLVRGKGLVEVLEACGLLSGSREVGRRLCGMEEWWIHTHCTTRVCRVCITRTRQFSPGGVLRSCCDTGQHTCSD